MKQQVSIKKADGVLALERLCAQVLGSAELPVRCIVRRKAALGAQVAPTFSVALSSGAALGFVVSGPLTRMARCEMIVKAARTIAQLGSASDARWIALSGNRHLPESEDYEVALGDPSNGLRSIVAQIHPQALAELGPMSSAVPAQGRALPVTLTLALFMKAPQRDTALPGALRSGGGSANTDIPSEVNLSSPLAPRRFRRRAVAVSSELASFTQLWRPAEKLGAEKLGAVTFDSSEWCLGVTDQWGRCFRAEFIDENRTGVRMTEERALKAEFPVQVELGTLSLASETLLELRPGDEIAIPESVPMVGTLRVGQTPWARVRIEQRGSEIVLTVEELLGLEETFSDKSRLTP